MVEKGNYNVRIVSDKYKTLESDIHIPASGKEVRSKLHLIRGFRHAKPSQERCRSRNKLGTLGWRRPGSAATVGGTIAILQSLETEPAPSGDAVISFHKQSFYRTFVHYIYRNLYHVKNHAQPSLSLPSLLLACTPTVETKTAIFLTMTTDGEYTLQDYADFAFVIVDPVEGGFLTAEGVEPSIGEYASGFGVETEFGNSMKTMMP